MSDVIALSPDDAWVVGDDNIDALVWHWDGMDWGRVPVALPDDSGLSALAAVGAIDVWAAGNYRAGNGSIQPLFLHWDGTSWTRVPQGPGTERSGGKIFDLAAFSSDDIWAVGYKGTPVFAEFEPLAEHWDGTSWQVVEVPNPPPGANVFNAVSGTGPDDVWAVGSVTDGGFIEHWDGATWSLELVRDGKVLLGVGAVAPDDVWAVGAVTRPRPFILHWDGVAWTRAPARAGLGSALTAVEVISPDDVWAVGNYFADDLSELDPVTLHYTGPCEP